jgi:hypothetical protein
MNARTHAHTDAHTGACVQARTIVRNAKHAHTHTRARTHTRPHKLFASRRITRTHARTRRGATRSRIHLSAAAVRTLSAPWVRRRSVARRCRSSRSSLRSRSTRRVRMWQRVCHARHGFADEASCRCMRRPDRRMQRAAGNERRATKRMRRTIASPSAV